MLTLALKLNDMYMTELVMLIVVAVHVVKHHAWRDAVLKLLDGQAAFARRRSAVR
jgi:hypothetical protein